MIQSVPKLAAWLAQNKKSSIKFHGVAIIIDIAESTALAERLTASGKPGAEILSRMLSSCFSRLIPAIHAGGGDIMRFTGDSILAVFPDTEKSAHKRLAESLERAYESTPFAEEEYSQKPKIRISAASGQITLGLHEHAGASVWIAGGSAVENAYRLGVGTGDPEEINYNTGPEADPSEKAVSAAVAASLSETPIAALAQGPRQSSFGNVQAVFARSNSPDTAEFIRTILECSEKTGADARYFAETDKGAIACVCLGYPHSAENIFLNAKEFMRQVQDSLKGGVSFGAAHGICYVGSVEAEGCAAHTCIGPAVTVAHRLMREATVGSTLIPKGDSAQWQRHAGLIHAGTIHCKGLKTPVTCMRITRYLTSPAMAPSLFAGRAEELASMETALGGGGKSLIRIYGPPGSGKSALVAEAARRADKAVVRVLLDRVTKTSLSGFSSACAALLQTISREGYGKQSSPEGMLDVARKTGLASRHISAIAAILDLPGHEQEFRACPESGRISFLADAMAALLSAADRLSPLVLVFENIHEYSAGDTALARALAKRELESPIQFIYTSADKNLSLFPDERDSPGVLAIALEPSGETQAAEPEAPAIEPATAETDASNIPLLVYRAERSENPKNLEEALLRGMRWAVARFRNDEAIEWSKKLLAISPDISLKVEASLLLAQTLAHTGKQDDAVAAFKNALDLAERSGSKENIATALCDLALLFMESGELEKAKPLAEKLPAMISETSPPLASRIYDTVIMHHYYIDDLAGARKLAEAQLEAAKKEDEPLLLAKAYASMTAVSLADRADDSEPLTWLNQQLTILQKTEDLRMLEECYYSFSVAYQRRNEFKLSLQYCSAHMDCAESIGDSAGFLSALLRRGSVKLMLGRYEEAVKDFRQLASLASKSENAGLLAAAKERLGNALSALGKPDEALPLYLDSYKMGKESGDQRACSVTAFAIGKICHERGETKKALAFLETELKRAKESDDALGKGLAYGYIGMILGEDGQTEKALECIDYAINNCKGHTVPSQLARLYVNKASCTLERLAASKTGPTQADKEIVTELCRKAAALSSEAGDPTVIDIPWKAKILEARVAGGDSMASLLLSVKPGELNPADKALYHYEASLLEPDANKAAGHLASARKLDTRLVDKCSRFYERIGVIPPTGSAS